MIHNSEPVSFASPTRLVIWIGRETSCVATGAIGFCRIVKTSHLSGWMTPAGRASLCLGAPIVPIGKVGGMAADSPPHTIHIRDGTLAASDRAHLSGQTRRDRQRPRHPHSRLKRNASEHWPAGADWFAAVLTNPPQCANVIATDQQYRVANFQPHHRFNA